MGNDGSNPSDLFDYIIIASLQAYQMAGSLS